MVFTIGVRCAQSVAGRFWNLVQHVWAISPLALIVLKLTGMIAWSWWWVLSPVWISVIIMAVLICAVPGFILWTSRETAGVRRLSTWLNKLSALRRKPTRLAGQAVAASLSGSAAYPALPPGMTGAWATPTAATGPACPR